MLGGAAEGEIIVTASAARANLVSALCVSKTPRNHRRFCPKRNICRKVFGGADAPLLKLYFIRQEKGRA